MPPVLDKRACESILERNHRWSQHISYSENTRTSICPKYCQYLQYPQYRTPKYRKYRERPQGNEPRNAASPTVSAVQHLEIMRVLAVSAVHKAEILRMYDVPAVLSRKYLAYSQIPPGSICGKKIIPYQYWCVPGMWITADFRLYPPVITANQELVSPTGDHRYRGGTERAHPRGFRV